MASRGRMMRGGEAATVAQHVVVMRHGDRIDHFDIRWAHRAPRPRPWDPPLTDAGKEKARARGAALPGELSFPITRVFSSPFLRCLQTAAEVLASLSRASSQPVKVAVEYGLSEVMNNMTIRAGAQEGGRWFPDTADLEAELPATSIDHSAEPLYNEIPPWGESIASAKQRYMSVIHALADKYPRDNLLLVTHADAVYVSLCNFRGPLVASVDYCGYCHLKRQITFSPSAPPIAKPFKPVSRYGILT